MFNIVHLYPKQLNLYGDTGNILVIQNILKLYGINFKTYKVGIGERFPTNTDFIMVGGGPDYLQEKIYDDFIKRKDFLENYFNNKKPSLFVCGSFQLLGNYYLDSTGKKLPGVGLFNFYTRSPDNQKSRIVGNIFMQSPIAPSDFSNKVVGFENHNGRTYIKNIRPFGKTSSISYGNNTVDFSEGFIYNKTIGTYLHGPLLVKNPHLLKYLLSDYVEIDLRRKDFISQLIPHLNALDLKR